MLLSFFFFARLSSQSQVDLLGSCLKKIYENMVVFNGWQEKLRAAEALAQQEAAAKKARNLAFLATLVAENQAAQEAKGKAALDSALKSFRGQEDVVQRKRVEREERVAQALPSDSVEEPVAAQVCD